jgi:NAD(P)-dependent dehydrogenase (short-subunit alcohol dehydrogenase family)
MVRADDVLRDFRLDGSVAAITGGARGIGRATAELFAAAGARVAILDVDHEAAQTTAASIGSSATAHQLDVGSERDVNRVFEALLRQEGRLDILVNNAGIAIRRPTTELALADWQRVVDINMTGVFLCARAAGRTMVAQGSGAIVTTASIMGLSGGGLYPNISYQATKGAVVNMTRALAIEWSRNGVRVNAVAPTWVDTEFIAGLKANPDLMAEIRRVTPMGRLAQPHEVACAILFLASPAAAMITGHVLPVDGGYLAQ